MKYFQCKKCEMVLVPGETSKIRVRKNKNDEFKLIRYLMFVIFFIALVNSFGKTTFSDVYFLLR